MNAVEHETYRKQLLEMRDRLIHAVEGSEHTLRENVATSGVSTLPTHPADLAAEGIDEEIAIVENEGQLLGEVYEALERMDAGTYGKCEDCGGAVAPERLAALPYTARCVNCARKLEAGD